MSDCPETADLVATNGGGKNGISARAGVGKQLWPRFTASVDVGFGNRFRQ